MIYLIGNPTRDKILIDDRTVETLGGSVLYAALLLKKLGRAVAVVGNGDQRMRNALARNGIVTRYFHPAGHAVEFENAYRGGRRIQKAKAGDPIRLHDVPKEAFAADAIMIGAVLQEVDVEITTFPRRGLLMLDVQGFLRHLSSAGDVDLHYDAHAEKAIRNCDILKVDRDEAFVITGTHSIDRAAQQLQCMGPEIVLVTLGARGACIYDGSRKATIEAPRVTAVDPTGAGDVFAAAFMDRYLTGVALETAGRFAAAAAALSTRSFGTTAVPNLEEIDHLLQSGWKS